MSCASNMSSPSVLSQDTDFYPKNLNHTSSSKPDFEEYRKSAKKEYEEHQDYLATDQYQVPDHSRIIMKMI
jgi:hypothetical protein